MEDDEFEEIQDRMFKYNIPISELLQTLCNERHLLYDDLMDDLNVMIYMKKREQLSCDEHELNWISGETVSCI